MRDSALVEAPDFFEPLEAWRVWRVLDENGELRLASIVKRTIWPTTEPLVSECLRLRSIVAALLRRPAHDAPADRCVCGIYATTHERCREYLADFDDAITRVAGRVLLWGTVVECERGYRASHAPASRYVAIDAPTRGQWSPEAIARGLAATASPSSSFHTTSSTTTRSPPPRAEIPDSEAAARAVRSARTELVVAVDGRGRLQPDAFDRELAAGHRRRFLALPS